MKNVMQVIGAIVISLQCYSQRIDFSVTDRYFQITDSLRKNISVKDASWNSFFQMNGMRQYIRNQHLELEVDGYRRSMEYVYMPKNDSLLNACLKNPETFNKTYMVYQHRELEDDLKSFIRKVKNRPDLYMDSIYENAYSLLPYKMQANSVNTTIYFVPLFKDAVADSFDILLTLYGAYHLDAVRYGATGGHLMHHMLRRNRMLASTKDQDLYDLLSTVLEEGMADLIDKPIPDSVEVPKPLKYCDQIKLSSENAVAVLDSMIRLHADGKQPFSATGQCSVSQMGGHVPGYSMALVIFKNGLINEAIRYTDDPLRFVLLYNKAAAMDESKPQQFSDKTIAYLKNLQKKLRNWR